LAINYRSPIDPRWAYHNRPVGYGLMLASVHIYNPASGSQEYDAETNTWSGNTTPLYEGKARIQPVSAINEVADTYNPTLIKTVRVQIAYNKNTLEDGVNPMPDIRPNDRMIVTNSPLNETLEKFIFVVTDVLNSSNSWERTLLCRVDTELDPTVTNG
jgi:hypothetical protein